MNRSTPHEKLLAIDPGTDQSGWVLFDPANKRVIEHGISSNEELLARLEAGQFDVTRLVIEKIASYGMPVGEEVFETCRLSGKFEQAFGSVCELVTRRRVKLFRCGTTSAKDSNVRQALIDMFGPGKERAIGRKHTPGPLYGVKSHKWAALALAVTATADEACNAS